MINSRVSDCKECADILPLIDAINCRLFEASSDMYNNLAYGLNRKIPAIDLLDLLNYKRILINRYADMNYACDFSVNQIANRVRILTAGCTTCIYKEPIVVFHTTTSTTTINPLAGDFEVHIGSSLTNKINSVLPEFYTTASGDFPVVYGETINGKVVSGGSSITVNYTCTEATPQVLVIKNNIVVGNAVGLPSGTNLSYTYNVSWLDTDDIIVALNFAP